LNTTDRPPSPFAILCLLMACLISLSSGQAKDAVADVVPAGAIQQRFESTQLPVEVVAEIVAGKTQVAVPLQYRVTIDAPPGATVDLPPIAGVSFNESKEIAIVDQRFADFLLTGIEVNRDLPLGSGSGKRRTQLILEIESLKSGWQQTPALEVVYRLADSATESSGSDSEGAILIPALGVEIGSVLQAEDTPMAFRDIKNAIATSGEIREKNSPVLPLLFVAFGTVFVSLVWWFRCKRCPKPEQWAFQRVHELQHAYESGSITITEVYDALSMVLRQYVQAACHTPATALCTAEFLDVLKQDGLSAEGVAAADAILSRADLSKFSPVPATPVESECSAFEQARCVIQESVRLTDRDEQTPVGERRAAIHPIGQAVQKVEA
jgi:hypothetical protein